MFCVCAVAINSMLYCLLQSNPLIHNSICFLLYVDIPFLASKEPFPFLKLWIMNRVKIST